MLAALAGAMTKLLLIDSSKIQEVQMGQEITIGRAYSNLLRLEGEEVSRVHSILYRRGSEYVLRDLDSKNGDANGVFRSGALNEKQPNNGADAFVYDPMDLRRGENVEGTNPKEKTAAIDQTFALSIGKDGLVYHTEPLPNETPLVGCPALSLWLSIDTPDVDLECDLYEIQPDGTSIALWSDLRRLRYRESLREAKLVKPGEVVRCDFNPGLFVARRLMKGSRLRLVVTAVNSILWQKNYCSGGIVAEETAKDAHTCNVQVYHDADHPSAIQLPLR